MLLGRVSDVCVPYLGTVVAVVGDERLTDAQDLALALRDTAFHDPRPALRLLSEYDAYVMGFREREHLVSDQVKEQVAAHSRGRYEGPAGVRFITVDGVAAGLWERKKRGKNLEITVAPTRRLPRAMRAELDAEVERIGAFMGLDPAITIE